MRVAHLARKPLSEGSVGRNVLVHGTGGINVDATRIEGPAWKWGTQTDIRGGGYGTKRPSGGHVLARNVESNPAGRWPANLVLVHRPECRCVGTKTVEGITGSAAGKMAGKNREVVYGNYKGSPEAGKRTGYASEDGTETVEAWDCVEGCPVKELDGQSGILTSGALLPGHHQGGGHTSYKKKGGTVWRAYGGDSGGASRFFKAVQNKG